MFLVIQQSKEDRSDTGKEKDSKIALKVEGASQ